MIYSLNGKLIFFDLAFAVVECGGVGYKCNASLKTIAALPKVGEQVFLYTHMNVREDAVDLFGFATVEEMKCFKTLTSVNGVGAKVGIAILSEFTPDYIYTFISSGDDKSLTAAAGVGPKLAQRIVLELKDKVGKAPTELAATGKEISSIESKLPVNNAQKAVSALVSLGFLQVEARRAISNLDPTMSVEDMIKQALTLLSSGKY